MKIVAKVNSRTILDSGIINLNIGEADWELLIEDLKFTFVFIDKGGQSPQVELGDHAVKASTIHLIDWNNVLGSSYAIPGLAIVNGKGVDVSFYVETSGEKGNFARCVSYTVSQADD